MIDFRFGDSSAAAGYAGAPAMTGINPAMQVQPAVQGPPPEVENAGGRGYWPRMIVLDQANHDRLIMWLADEIGKCYVERAPLLTDWERWQTDYWARPEKAVKLFPFRRAANIVVPLTAIAVEAVHARLMNTLFSVKPFWSIRPRSKSWIEAAPEVQTWLQTEAENENSLDTFNFCNHSLLELIKLGTAVGKSGYDRKIKKSKRFLGDGREDPLYVEVRNGATLEYVPLANFLMRLHETDPQEAAWCGEDHQFSWSQLKRMALSGRMRPDAVERIRNFFTYSRGTTAGDPGQYRATIEHLANTEPVWNETFRVKEIWCSFDVDGDGIDEEIVVDFHMESRTILSIRYNWYADLHRPYRGCQYVVVEGRFYGIGVGKQNEQFQREVTTIHRQRLDNATLANMQMFKIRKMSGYGPDEPIFPGKMWFLDNLDDIQPFKVAEIYPSSYSNEEAVVRYSEKRTGVNEALLGMPAMGTPGTATSDLAKLAESNKRFDLVLKNVRRWLSLLGQDCLANFQQFGDQQRHWLVEEADGMFVERVLNMPQELVMHGAIVDLSVTDSIANRDVERQNWMALFQIITNYYSQILAQAQIVAQIQGDPSMFLQVSQMALSASDAAMRRLLETFNIVDIDALLLTSRKGQGDAAPPGQPAPRPAGGPPTANAAPGVADLLRALGQGGSGGFSLPGSGVNG